MLPPDLVIRGHRVVTPVSTAPASVHIRDGRISRVGSYDDVPGGCVVSEASEDSVVMPGLVDTHVHINEPGRTDWEGFATATRAAAAGGVTTVVEMPLNSIPPTTTLEGFKAKLKAAEGQCSVDVGFWGGIVPGNFAELRSLSEAGVLGFKCFLVHSGVDEFPNVTEPDLRAAMPLLAQLGAVLIVHAETPAPIEESLKALTQAGGPEDLRHYWTFLESRPGRAEDEAVALMIRLSRETGARVHIVHHSSAEALPLLRAAKAEGLPVTVETCPHYLSFCAEEIPKGATEFKCCPPIRERENRGHLWDALEEGLIGMVVSDHSPCPPEMKLRESGDFLQAWGGISSLQFRLPVMWTEMTRRAKTASLNRLVQWLANAPATLVGLQHRKGAIQEGHDADIIIWNPSKTFTVEPQMIQHRHKLTPYLGQELSGVVEQTFLRGEKIYDRGHFVSGPTGRMLLRGDL
ncbi:MAG TPA: allantoinase AllB [Pyrinomonadaceae bacterium]|jgi:allantoinase|nr:allantoinase AllB [Pyrinomonadaceae bacterium]